MIEAMGIAIGLADSNTKVILSHGVGFTDREGMLEVHTLLIMLRDRIQEQIDEGRRLDDFLAANLTMGLDDRWGQMPSWKAVDVLPIVLEELK